jgi:hypothetical protein
VLPIDAVTHPELQFGTIDYSVSDTYSETRIINGERITVPPVSPRYIFIIDFSFQAVTSGFTRIVGEAISRILFPEARTSSDGHESVNLEGRPSRLRPEAVAIIGFDSRLYFHQFGASTYGLNFHPSAYNP